MEYKEIIYSLEGQVAMVTLNRPEAMCRANRLNVMIIIAWRTLSLPDE